MANNVQLSTIKAEVNKEEDKLLVRKLKFRMVEEEKEFAKMD